MAEACVIRPLTEEDLHAYRALRLSMLEAHPDAFTSDALTEVSRSAESYRSRLGDQRVETGHFTLGAFSGGRLVGAVSCEREPRLKARHIAHLSGMMVEAGARGQGIGRALLAACIERARRATGLERLTLNVSVGNGAARALYASAGFERYGLLERAVKLGDRYIDKEMMALWVEDGPPPTA